MLRLTDRATDVMNFARIEAENLRNGEIGTEHALLGIMRDGGGIAARLGERLGLKTDVLRKGIAMLNPPSAAARSPGVALAYSREMSRAMERARTTADRLLHGEIGVGHLFLGLVDNPQCKAALFLSNLGLDLKEIRRVVLESLSPPPR